MSKHWNDERKEQLRRLYIEEREGGRGVMARIAKRLGRRTTRRAVEHALYNLPDWKELRSWVKPVAPPEPEEVVEHDPTDPALRKAERRVVALGDEVRQLRLKLRHSDRKDGIVLELAEQLESFVEPMLAPLSVLTNTNIERKQEPVDAVVTLSDQHADRVVRTAGSWGLERYDFNVYRARLFEWAKTIGRYCSVHLPNYKFETLWVWHLGDAVNGDIHNMKHRNHFGNSMVASLAIGDAQSEALAYLSQFFERIAVVCVPGNHGRTTQKVEWEDPFDNFDYLVAKTMKLRLDNNDKVEIFTPRAWSAFVEVRGHLWNLNHGHGVKGVMGIPWYGFERREGRVQRLATFNNRPVDYFAYGHFHTPMTRPSGRGKAVHSGAWYFTDEYALNQLAVGNTPEQTLLVFSERFGRQMEIPLMVRDEEKEQLMFNGEYEPPFGRNLVVDEPDDPALGTTPIIT